MAIIEEFTARYRREYDYYLEVSRLCAEQCETGLEETGIKAIVTHRAKRPDRLERKLRGRILEKRYSSIEDIYLDIVDLAGVRIALYFPSDRHQVEKIIKAQFDVVDPPKVFPDTAVSKYQKLFQGYSAVHYRIRLKVSSLGEEQVRYSDAAVEVQVASVLMHAWAEVEHDLVYKPLGGTLSEDEYVILDQLNGLVLGGESSLEQLQKALRLRVQKPTWAFSNHYELASYLYENIRARRAKDLPEPIIGRVDSLFSLVQEAGINRSEEIGRLVDGLDPDAGKRPISEQIIDHLLTEHPRLYKVYEKLREQEPEMMRDIGNAHGTQVKADQTAVGVFLGKWARLDKALREIAIVLRPGVPADMSLSPSGIRALKLFGSEKVVEFEHVRGVRNSLIHGKQSPEVEEITHAADSIDHLLDALKVHKNEQVRNVLAKHESSTLTPSS